MGLAQPKTVCVVGTGYVGMACLIGFAELGHNVRGYDVLSERIERLRAGHPPYREAGIEVSLRQHLADGRLQVFSSLGEAVADADFIIIAVGTPSLDDGSLDLRALESAICALSLIDYTRPPILVIRSTVPPGSSDTLACRTRNVGPLIYAPEFLREGSAVDDFLNPHRIVAGAAYEDAALAYAGLFASMDRPIIVTSRRNAEFIKCCSNAFLALKISFANEVANLCEPLGAVADDVLLGIGADRRIGSEFLRPGIGFGGPCFEKDVRSVAHFAKRYGVREELFSATLLVNERQPYRVIELLAHQLGSLRGLEIGVWGLAFKAGTDDVRDSLAMLIISELTKRGATTRAYDPAVRVAQLPPGCTIVGSALAATDADALIVLTEWSEFASIEPEDVRARLRRGVVIDGRNILDPRAYAAAGLQYCGIGRPLVSSPYESDQPETSDTVTGTHGVDGGDDDVDSQDSRSLAPLRPAAAEGSGAVAQAI